MRLTSVIAVGMALAGEALAAWKGGCAPGYYYCGWYLINNEGWDHEAVRPAYCSGAGGRACDDLNRNGAPIWDSQYYCTSNGRVQYVKYCGSGGCSGADQQCSNPGWGFNYGWPQPPSWSPPGNIVNWGPISSTFTTW